MKNTTIRLSLFINATFYLGVFLLLLMLLNVDAIAEESEVGLAGHTPQICLGLAGVKRTNVGEEQSLVLCPKHHAYFDISIAGGNRNADPDVFSSIGVCCPLPSEDILDERYSIEAKKCPRNYIVTGGLSHDYECPDCVSPMRCTRINTQRYKLADKKPGAYWGFDSAFLQQHTVFLKGDIPAAIRHAIGRTGQFSWRGSGCVGYPFGSLFVEKAGKRCPDLFFQQLLYRGVKGDPPEGSPVKMFPNCIRLLNRETDKPTCLES